MIKGLKLTALWSVLLVSGIVMVMQMMTIYRVQEQNNWIAGLNAKQDIHADKLIHAAPEVRLARAMYYQRQHRYDEALATLSLIMDKGDTKLQAIVRYNLGNVYLQQAIEKIAAENSNAAQPLVALAKQAYRQSLALNSEFWDAKYNLELAMRLLPEMDKVDMKDDDAKTPPSQLWTTIPGFPRGLP
ncbi:MAG: MxaK protein [Methylococcales bacterium]